MSPQLIESPPRICGGSPEVSIVGVGPVLESGASVGAGSLRERCWWQQKQGQSRGSSGSAPLGCKPSMVQEAEAVG